MDYHDMWISPGMVVLAEALHATLHFAKHIQRVYSSKSKTLPRPWWKPSSVINLTASLCHGHFRHHWICWIL